MAGVAWYAIGNSPNTKLGSTPVSQVLQGATSANVRITDPVGRLEVSSGASGDMLLEGTTQMIGPMNLSQDYDVQSKHGSLNLSTKGEGPFAWWGGMSEPLWALELTENVPLTLNTETAAGSLALDLTGLDVTELKATVAVGSLELTLDPQDEFEGRLENPIGRIRILVPAGTLVEFTMDTVISTANLPAGFVKNGKVDLFARCYCR